MRWLTCVILIVVTVCLQSTMAPRWSWLGASPDWILVLVLFYALHARTDQALVAGWVAGALADLLTLERFGLLSLSYGLIAIAVSQVRDWMFVRHPLTHFGVTLLGAMIVRLAWAAYRAALDLPGEGLALMGWACLYTAAWAPPLHWLLLKASHSLGLDVRRGDPRHRPGRAPQGRGRRV